MQIKTAILSLVAWAAMAQPVDLFSTQVQPLLTAKCLPCHNAQARTSGLDLSTREAMLKGGAQGPAVVAGNSAQSRLMQYVASGKMPPSGALKPEEIDLLRKWIDTGATWTGASLKQDRAGPDWWSLQRPVKPVVPVVAGATHPIDAFLLAKLNEKGLEFAPEASRETLLRRLSFDLTGLPPTHPEETVEQSVERMLASPSYGERWARHWLDVVRFGETDGGEHNNERFTAWKYRDYVIRALNADKPYDQFVREQVAGDILRPDDPETVAATGFLVCGPWDSVTKKINKDELQRNTIRQDELDDMVTTTFATFQGLTVNCARCHDHKFDPIPTRDYYRLTGVFRGAGFGERDLATKQEKEAREALLEPLRKQSSELKKRLGRIEDPVKTRLLLSKLKEADASRGAGQRRLQLNAVFNRNLFPSVRTRYLRLLITSQQGKAVPRLDYLELRPAAFSIEGWKAEAEASDDKPVTLSMDLGAEKEVSELIFSSDRATGQRDGFLRVYRLEASGDGVNWRQIGSSLDHEVPAEFALPVVKEDELLAQLTPAQIAERKDLLGRIKQVEAGIAAVPPLPSVHGVTHEPMTPTRILNRGSLVTPGEEVSPGALSAISAELGLTTSSTDAGRRTALAQWLTGPNNPLTARVIVNRIWYHHFGNGIVNTPSDFGYNGDKPSHPELLDWLAVEFMEHGWSLKWLHRQIVSTRAYRQSSALNREAMRIDAGNRLVWHMPVKRMDGEMLRDTILFVSGNLQTQTGGAPFFLQRKESMGSYMHKRVNTDGPEVWRRAVYRFVVRGGERIFLDSFDCPDPAVATPQRSVSNTPVQVFTLLNNDFVLRQAAYLASRLKREAGEDQKRQVRLAYGLLYGRKPSPAEFAAASRFLAKQPLDLYCRALLNTNEFVHVP